MKITSVNNDLIKETAKLLQKKYREESGLFILEGEKGVSEAISAGIEIKHIFALENIDINFDNIIEVSEQVMSKITETKSVPKIVAVAKQPTYDIKTLAEKNRVVLLESIKDAGNLGTILRTSSAFGVDGIVLFGDTVDLYNPKCVRSTVGNLWKTPVFHIKDFNDLERYFKHHEIIATLPKAENVIELKNYTPTNKTLLMFGSEADGLSNDLKEFATKNLTIEMDSKVESLNLSISVGIILYKLSIN